MLLRLVPPLLILLFQFTFVDSDRLFQEGFFAFEDIPGNSGDPNTPFSTHTERATDGVTTTSAYTTTSPHFPIYTGSIANTSDRYLHYLRYAKSAEEQGIALIGAGDAEIETARLKFVKKNNYQSIPRPTKNFTVRAALRWNPSDFAIQVGETYEVAVYGNDTGYGDQFWNDGGIRVDAAGYSSYFDSVSNCYVSLGRCRPYLKKRRRLPEANWMSLACAIGEYVRPLANIEAGKEAEYRWMPLDESALIGTMFNVGKATTFRAVYSGQLICFANDAYNLYWNNYGSLQVTVTRVSWPPSSDAVYEPLTFPSCDSAQVVYVNKGENDGSNPSKVKCNPSSGGSGWKDEDIRRTSGTYGFAAPDSIYADLPPEALA